MTVEMGDNVFRSLLAHVLTVGLSAFAAQAAIAGKTDDVSFTEVPSYASAESMLRRLTHGLQYRQAMADARKGGVNLGLATVNPRKERWQLHTPAQKSQPYRLLVWVSSDDDGDVPQAVLDAALSRNVAVLSAIEAGENERLIEKRAAMVLAGMHGFISTHPTDRSNILIGGEGEAAQVAELIGLGYADIFAGILAIDGGAPVGSHAIPVPVMPLPERIRQHSDIVFVGDNVSSGEAITSLRDFCAAGASQAADVGAALDLMLATTSFPIDQQCLKAYNENMVRELEVIDEAFANQDWPGAMDKLLEVHMKYGGLAETQVFAYQDKLLENQKDLNVRAAEFLHKRPQELRNRPDPKPRTQSPPPGDF